MTFTILTKSKKQQLINWKIQSKGLFKENFTLVHEIWLLLINYNFLWFYDLLFLKYQKIDNCSWDICVFWYRNMFLYIFWIIRNYYYSLIRLTSLWAKASFNIYIPLSFIDNSFQERREILKIQTAWRKYYQPQINIAYTR